MLIFRWDFAIDDAAFLFAAAASASHAAIRRHIFFHYDADTSRWCHAAFLLRLHIFATRGEVRRQRRRRQVGRRFVTCLFTTLRRHCRPLRLIAADFRHWCFFRVVFMPVSAFIFAYYQIFDSSSPYLLAFTPRLRHFAAMKVISPRHSLFRLTLLSLSITPPPSYAIIDVSLSA